MGLSQPPHPKERGFPRSLMNNHVTAHKPPSIALSQLHRILNDLDVLYPDEAPPCLESLVRDERFCPGVLFSPNKEEIISYREHLRDLVQEKDINTELMVDVLKYMYEMSRTVMVSLGGTGFNASTYIHWSLSLRRDILGLLVTHAHRLNEDMVQAVRPLMQDIQNSLELRFAVQPVFDKGGLAVLLISQSIAEQKDMSGFTEMARKFMFQILKQPENRAELKEQVRVITHALNHLGFTLKHNFIDHLLKKADSFCLSRDAEFAKLMNTCPEMTPCQLIGHDAHRLTRLYNRLMDAPDCGEPLQIESLKQARLDKQSLGYEKIMDIVLCLRSLTDHAQRMMGVHESFPPEKTITWLEQAQSSLASCIAKFCFHKHHRENQALLPTLAELIDEKPLLDREAALRCLILFENDSVRLPRLMKDRSVIQLLDGEAKDLADLAIKTGVVPRSQVMSLLKKWKPDTDLRDTAFDKIKRFQLMGSFSL